MQAFLTVQTPGQALLLTSCEYDTAYVHASCACWQQGVYFLLYVLCLHTAYVHASFACWHQGLFFLLYAMCIDTAYVHASCACWQQGDHSWHYGSWLHNLRHLRKKGGKTGYLLPLYHFVIHSMSTMQILLAPHYTVLSQLCLFETKNVLLILLNEVQALALCTHGHCWQLWHLAKYTYHLYWNECIVDCDMITVWHVCVFAAGPKLPNTSWHALLWDPLYANLDFQHFACGPWNVPLQLEMLWSAVSWSWWLCVTVRMQSSANGETWDAALKSFMPDSSCSPQYLACLCICIVVYHACRLMQSQPGLIGNLLTDCHHHTCTLEAAVISLAGMTWFSANVCCVYRFLTVARHQRPSLLQQSWAVLRGVYFVRDCMANCAHPQADALQRASLCTVMDV